MSIFNNNHQILDKQKKKKKRNVWSIKKEQKADNINCLWGGPDVGLTTQKLQSRYHNCVQRTKETIFKEQKEGMIIVSHKIENIY